MIGFNKVSSLFNNAISKNLYVVDLEDVKVKVEFSEDYTSMVFRAGLYDGEISENLENRLKGNIVLGDAVVPAKVCWDKEKKEVYLEYREDLDQVNYPRFNELVDDLAWLAKECSSFFRKDVSDEVEFLYINR